jgi:hypothetical protein
VDSIYPGFIKGRKKKYGYLGTYLEKETILGSRGELSRNNPLFPTIFLLAKQPRKTGRKKIDSCRKCR